MNMMHSIDVIEKRRLVIQAALDAEKTKEGRNRLGQFATPTILAQDILNYAITLLPKTEKVRFLDPAFGTGVFYSALMKVSPKNRVAEAIGFEIDPHYGKPSQKLWEENGVTIKLVDFTCENATPRYNLIICNPPYVRHHHILNGDKVRLQEKTIHASGMKVCGLAGLYCYFLGLSHAWMTDGGVAGWLIPSEFMDVNYGNAVKHYLLNNVTLLHIHRFDPNDVQFADALVSSAVVWFRKEPPPKNHRVLFTFGGTLLKWKLSRKVSNRDLASEAKWTRFPAAEVRLRNTTPAISDFFHIKRGIATGHNNYFILSEEEIMARNLPMEVFTPILPSPRYLPEDEVNADDKGNPLTSQRLFLLDTKLTEDEIRHRFPALHAYLEEGKARRIHDRYLCQHRTLWYSQEHRPPAPIVCTYLGRSNEKRGHPFRFILNRSRATVANVYLAMYPTQILARAMEKDPEIIRHVWEILNLLTPEQILDEGRVYGGGLHKLEPKELANVPAAEIADLLPKGWLPTKQAELFSALAS